MRRIDYLFPQQQDRRLFLFLYEVLYIYVSEIEKYIKQKNRSKYNNSNMLVYIIWCILSTLCKAINYINKIENNHLNSIYTIFKLIQDNKYLDLKERFSCKSDLKAHRSISPDINSSQHESTNSDPWYLFPFCMHFVACSS